MGYLGYLLDKKTGHENLFMAIGAGFGIVWAMYDAIKVAYLISSDETKEEIQNETK